MWDYSDKVKDYFFNPVNAGVLEEANAVGDVGSISCGDALRLMLKVDPETDVILDARFQTFGCGSAIASSSALTEMIKGMTLDQALKITNQDIAAYLDGLPPEKMHCSVMGAEALHAAIANYRGEEWKDDHEEGELVCKCFGVDAALIERTVRDNNLVTVEQVANYTKAGGGCCSCHEKIEDILIAVNGELAATAKPTLVQQPTPRTLVQIAPLKPEPAPAPAKPAMTMVRKIQLIEKVLEDIRPSLKMDGGNAELIDVDGDTVYLHLTGACMGCSSSGLTIAGIQERLMLAFGKPMRVVPSKPTAEA